MVWEDSAAQPFHHRPGRVQGLLVVGQDLVDDPSLAASSSVSHASM